MVVLNRGFRFIQLVLLFLSASTGDAWVVRSGLSTFRQANIAPTKFSTQGVLFSSTEEQTSTDLSISQNNTAISSEEDNEDEYEYIEYDVLTETELLNSEWLVGTNWDSRPDRIDETWARLIVDRDGKNVVVWGDGSEGKWSLDVASQFLSLSKENRFAGKDIWACSISDYYYLQGTVRGWKFWSAASVLGQWQARRLGVDPDEAGVAPWFQDNDDDVDPEAANESIEESEPSASNASQ